MQNLIEVEKKDKTEFEQEYTVVLDGYPERVILGTVAEMWMATDKYGEKITRWGYWLDNCIPSFELHSPAADREIAIAKVIQYGAFRIAKTVDYELGMKESMDELN